MADYSEHLGIIAALSAGMIWGFIGIFVRVADDLGIAPVQLTCLRYMMIAVVAGAYILIKDRSLLRIDRRAAAAIAVMGVVGTLLNSATYLQSMTMVSLSLASVLQYTAPFFVILLSVPILKEGLTRNKAVAVAVAFTGCVLCAVADMGPMNLLGIALGAFSGICFSIYTIEAKVVSKGGYGASTVFFYTSLICCVGLAPFSDLPAAVGIMASSTDALLVVVGMGLFITLLPFLLFYYSLTKIEAGKASILTYAEPLAATVYGALLYGEEVTVGMAVGIAMIFAALMIVNRRVAPIPGRCGDRSGSVREGRRGVR